jgi:hypothetical protein
LPNPHKGNKRRNINRRNRRENYSVKNRTVFKLPDEYNVAKTIQESKIDGRATRLQSCLQIDDITMEMLLRKNDNGRTEDSHALCIDTKSSSFFGKNNSFMYKTTGPYGLLTPPNGKRSPGKLLDSSIPEVDKLPESFGGDNDSHFRTNRSSNMFHQNNLRSDHGVNFFRGSIEKMDCVKQ